MRISAVILRSKAGDRRRLQIAKEGVTLFSGGSGTGKTSILHIIDYCLGASEYRGPKVDKFESLAHVGVEFDANGSVFSVFRSITNANLCWMVHAGDEPGEFLTHEAVSRTVLLDHLNSVLGFSEVFALPSSGSSRPPHRISVRTWSKMAILEHHEIISPFVFFHRINPRTPDLIQLRESWPYFIGAYRDSSSEISEQIKELWGKQGEASSLSLESINSIAGKFNVLLEQIHRRAILVELPSSKSAFKKVRKFRNSNSSFDSTYSELSRLLSALQLELNSFEYPLVSTSSLIDDHLENERSRRDELDESLKKLRREYRGYSSEIRNLKKILPDSKDSNAIGDFGRNILSIDGGNSVSSCPLCSANWNPSEEDFQQKFSTSRSASSVVKANLGALEAGKRAIAKEIQESEFNLNQSISEIQSLLDSLEEDSKNSELRRTIESLHVDVPMAQYLLENIKSQCDRYQQELDIEDNSVSAREDLLERVGSAAFSMTLNFDEVATGNLDDLYRKSDSVKPTIRTNLSKMSILIGRGPSVVKLEDWGSSNNYMVSKVAYRLSILELSDTRVNSFPAFQILDQPSSVWGGSHGSGQGAIDERQQHEFFSTLIQKVRHCKGQLILLEHDLPPGLEWTKRYDWTEGANGLIPTSW